MRRTLLVAALLAATVSSVGKATDADDEKVVAKLSEQITDAAVKGDSTFMDGVMADNWVIIAPDGAIEEKAKHLKDIKDGIIKYEAMDKSGIKVRVFGDAAVVTGHMQTKLKFKGRAVGGPVSFTEVFIRQGAKWRSVSVQVTRVAAQPGENP